ncbi:MAG TPA: hypothetical protein VMW24_16270 [Sedimentisphaerales bacterium]|nr:hypothetical protein [Sedimentisphaerales bacterium]
MSKTMGEQIIDYIISASLFTTSGDGIIVWSANAAEQLTEHIAHIQQELKTTP